MRVRACVRACVFLCTRPYVRECVRIEFKETFHPLYKATLYFRRHSTPTPPPSPPSAPFKTTTTTKVKMRRKMNCRRRKKRKESILTGNSGFGKQRTMLIVIGRDDYRIAEAGEGAKRGSNCSCPGGIGRVTRSSRVGRQGRRLHLSPL